MPGRLGQITDDRTWPETNPNISSDLNAFGQVLFDPAPFDSDFKQGQGNYDDYRIPPPNRWTISAVKAPSFLEDFYFRVHVAPTLTDLGNLLSVQVRDLEVWNAHFVTKDLNSISSTGTDGIVLTEPTPPPTTFNPLEARTYNLNIDIKGPPIVDASYTFNFTGESPVALIIGRRVVVWPFIPQTKHRERLEWKTDIIPSFNNEQRIALRPAPRQSFSYNYQLNELQFSRAKAISTQWAQRVYGMPVWSEMTFIGAISAGVTEILFDTADADYRDNDIFLIWESDENFEAVESLDVLSDRINLKLALPNAYTNAYVAPIRYARTLQGMDYTRSDTDVIQARSNFIVTENKDLGATIGYDQYRSTDVIPERTVLVRDIQEKISRAVDLFDNGSGPIQVEVQRNWVNSTTSIAFDTLTREERWQARQWIHSRRGKQKSFWLPSWNRDLHLVTDATSSNSSLVCSPIGYALYYETTDILIKLLDGTKAYNRVLSAITDNDGNEVLTLENQLGVDVNVAEVDFICFMSHVRFNTDRVEISHDYAGRAIMPIAVIETPES